MTGPRDWDKELAEIDKLMAQPAAKASEPPRAAAPAGGPGTGLSPRAAGGAATVRPVTLFAVALLGPLGAGALAIWPYGKACSLPLLAYLVGVLAVFGASVWAMRLAWRARRGGVMLLGLATMLAALMLAALEVLPRIGYAKVAMEWVCS